MGISLAKEEGGRIYIYDENGNKSATVGRADGLQGYTSSSVNVKEGSLICMYDELGNVIKTISE
jgi:hypothetical protein